jgi:hypothetical protein
MIWVRYLLGSCAQFMNLANHAAALNSSRGAAFGFASIAKLAGEQLAPYVPPLVPKLYRYPVVCTWQQSAVFVSARRTSSAATEQKQRLAARGCSRSNTYGSS